MDLESVKRFTQIYDTDEKEKLLLFTDATIKTDDGCVFAVHRVILSRNNSYFYALFTSLDGQHRGEFLIPGISGETLCDLLIFVYTGRIALTKQNVTDIMVGADYLLVENIYNKIQQCIGNLISSENSVNIYKKAGEINGDIVTNAALKFIQFHFSAIVGKHRALLAELSMELFSRILCTGRLRTTGERTIWLAIVEWVQKDAQNRMSCVPLLLTYLARKEIDEKLAEEILSHPIVENNSYCKVIGYHQSGTSLKILQNFLRIETDHSVDCRIPSKLHLIIKTVSEKNANNYYIYVTYDEHLDLWRKIAKIDNKACLIAIKNILYVFLFAHHWKCLKLDLRDNTFLQEETLNPHGFTSVVKLEKSIYVFDDYPVDERSAAVFSTESNLWNHRISLCNLYMPQIACLSGKMYAIGRGLNGVRGIVFQVYSEESATWSALTSPSEVNIGTLILIAYKSSLVLCGLAGDRDVRPVEIYEPNNQIWRRVQDLPSHYNDPRAIVWKGDIYVYDEENISTTYVWSEPQKCWRGLPESHPVKVALRQSADHQIWEIDDVEAIGHLYNGNRNENARFDRFGL